MLPATIRWIVPVGLLTALTGTMNTARAEVLEVRGTAKALVVQSAGFIPVQTDFSQESVPLTQPQPPAVARARLDRILADGTTSAAGQALAIFDRPDVLAGGTPNDVGLDLGAFSDDADTHWFVEGAVSEVRKLQLSAADITSEIRFGGLARVRSRVLLSGVLLITASDAGRDLTGAKVQLSLGVTLRQDGRVPATPLVGEVNFVGLPDGNAQVESATGALGGLFLPVVDFGAQIPELPVVRAVPFIGVNLPYPYEIIVDRPFELELFVRAQVFAVPNGVGAAAVFGAPAEGLGSVLTRIKGDDRGQKLAEAIARHVDTTGQAYAGTPIDAPPPSIFPACGTAGLDSVGLLLFAGLAACSRSRRHHAVAARGPRQNGHQHGREFL